MEETQHNIYQQGASDGLLMGLYFICMYAMQVSGLFAFALVGQAMMLGVPFVAYYMMKRGLRYHLSFPQFSAIWMHGITIFLCGSLIFGLATYIYFRFINPFFIRDMFEQVSELYMQMDTEQSKRIGAAFQSLVDHRMLPTPISFAFSLMWLGAFTGSLLSLIIAAILKLKHSYRQKNRI